LSVPRVFPYKPTFHYCITTIGSTYIYPHESYWIFQLSNLKPSRNLHPMHLPYHQHVALPCLFHQHPLRLHPNCYFHLIIIKLLTILLYGDQVFLLDSASSIINSIIHAEQTISSSFLRRLKDGWRGLCVTIITT
jgi:hypothetical protein